MLNTNLLTALWTLAFLPDTTLLDKELETTILGDPYEYKTIFSFIEECAVIAWYRTDCTGDDWRSTHDPAWQLYNFAKKNLAV